MSSAEDLFHEAEKKTRKLFFKDYEGAQELFAKAGAQFKIKREYSRAGDAYARAGDCAVVNKDMLSAAQYYADASKTTRAVDVKRSAQLLDLAIQMQIDNNRLSGAAKLLKEFADGICAQNTSSMEAVPYYEKAIQYFQAEDMKAQVHNCQVALGRIHGENDDFAKALGYYERAANSMVGGPLKFQAQEYFICAMLCRFAMVHNDNRMEASAECEEALAQYMTTDIYLKNTREAEFLQNIQDSLAECDMDKFERGVALLDDLRKLDAWKTHVLLVVKHNMESLE